MVVYQIDKARRIIVAVYEKGQLDVEESLHHMLLKIVQDNSIVNIDIDIFSILKKYEHRMSLVGVARCHKDDTWNIEKGKEIARNRLNRKFTVLKNDILRDISKRLDNVYNHVTDKIIHKMF